MNIEKIERMTDSIVKLSNTLDGRSGQNLYQVHGAINALADKIKSETLAIDPVIPFSTINAT